MRGVINPLVRQLIDRVYPVSVILDFAAEVDPNAAIGCGTRWERLADGRTLISSDKDHPVGWVGGEATHVLTEAELAGHSHGIVQLGTDGERNMLMGKDGAYTDAGFLSFGTGVKPFAESSIYIGNTGGNQPHNNMQPSRAVCRWQRVA